MLPYGKQCIDDDDVAAVVEALRSDFLTTGPKIAEFEAALCKATDAKHAIACSNGTTALHLAAIALDIKEGDAVIVPSVTFLATANAVRYTGAEVVFCDVDPQTGLMNAQHLEEALTRCGHLKAKAVFPVHLTGQCVDLKSLKIVADRHNLKIMSDSCHALGSLNNGHLAGSGIDEDMAIFSFHSVKTVAMGEGGAITTNNDDWANQMRTLRTHGMVRKPDPNPWNYEMQDLGYNYRVTDIQCALGLSQIKKLPRFIERRREIVEMYDDLLAPLHNVLQTPVHVKNCTPAWHLYALRIDFDALGTTRAAVMNALRDKGVGTQVHYIPVHQQPYYQKRYGELSLPGADTYYNNTLSIPLYPHMTDDDVRHVVKSLTEVLGR